MDRSQTWRSTAVPNRTRNSTSESTFDRSGSDRYRSNDRSGNSPDRHSSDVHGNSSWSGNNHGSSFGSGYGSHRNGQHYSTHGQVSHVDHYHGGYRVWLGGVPFPFFVPLAYFQSDHFRIGLNVNMGGYYNPLGYYDYDNGYYRGSYYGGVYNGGNYYRGSYPSSGVASAGVLRGVVESVDDRNGTFVIRNDATGSFVTVEMRDRNRNDIRPGDYLQLSGDWSRSGLFLAYDVNMLQADGDYDR